jgi:hypothetical protein
MRGTPSLRGGLIGRIVDELPDGVDAVIGLRRGRPPQQIRGRVGMHTRSAQFGEHGRARRGVADAS